MGSFNVKCSLSGLNITYGEDIILSLIAFRKDNNMPTNFSYYDSINGYILIENPIVGKYNDYGWIDDANGNFDDFLKRHIEQDYLYKQNKLVKSINEIYEYDKTYPFSKKLFLKVYEDLSKKTVTEYTHPSTKEVFSHTVYGQTINQMLTYTIISKNAFYAVMGENTEINNINLKRAFSTLQTPILPVIFASQHEEIDIQINFHTKMIEILKHRRDRRIAEIVCDDYPSKCSICKDESKMWCQEEINNLKKEQL